MERGGGEVALRGRSDRDGFVANEMARWVVFGSVLELLYCRFSAWGLLGFDILSGRVFTVSRCVFFFFWFISCISKGEGGRWEWSDHGYVVTSTCIYFWSEHSGMA